MKNQLASIYEQMLLSESEKSELQNPSKDEVGSLKAKQDLFGSKPKVVEGPDKAKVKQGPAYEQTAGSSSAPKAEKSSSMKGAAPAKAAKPEEAEEMEDTEVDPTKEEDEKEKKKEQKNESAQTVTLGAFEALFKKTLTEEMGEEEIYEEEPETEESEVDTSEEESSEEGELEEEGDLISDLKDLHNRLAEILTKLEDVAEEGEVDSESEEYTDQDFEEEFGEEEAVKEAMEKPKPLANTKGKALQSKQNKVGSIKPKGGKAHTGSIKEEPELKALGDKKAHLQKGKPEVKSSVKKGEFIK